MWLLNFGWLLEFIAILDIASIVVVYKIVKLGASSGRSRWTLEIRADGCCNLMSLDGSPQLNSKRLTIFSIRYFGDHTSQASEEIGGNRSQKLLSSTTR